jgi:hypothetical protein
MNINFNDIIRVGDEYHYSYHTKTGFIFKKHINIRFIAKYPHYNIRDILWMLESTMLNDPFFDDVEKCGNEWSKRTDIKIGTLDSTVIKTSNMTSDVNTQACRKQDKLRKKYTEETGISYPDLKMPKRNL